MTATLFGRTVVIYGNRPARPWRTVALSIPHSVGDDVTFGVGAVGSVVAAAVGAAIESLYRCRLCRRFC